MSLEENGQTNTDIIPLIEADLQFVKGKRRSEAFVVYW